MIKKKIIIATGGTGGHVFPAYSLANYLKNKNFSVKLTSDKRGAIYLKDYNDLNIVKISSTKPISKLKRWQVSQIVRKAVRLG